MGSAESQYLTILGISTAAAMSLYFLLPMITGVGSRTKGPVVPGLRNWGNWCFCNSVLQTLSSLPALTRWLNANLPESDHGEGEKREQSSSSSSSLPLSRTMRDMIRVLNIEGPSKVLSSSPLIAALEALQGNRISRAQQDAQEFLHMLLESIAAEQNRLPVTVSLQQMSHQAAKDGHTYKALPFEGAVKTTTICTACHHELKTHITPFLELTLLPPTQTSISLVDCIAATLNGEYIEDYNCVYCQVHLLQRQGRDTSMYEEALRQDPGYDLPKTMPRSSVTLKRTASISTLPEILILHINRSLFGAYATRNTISVTYHDTLALGDETYTLRSFVTHSGSHDRGHYISYRRKHGRWYVISDESVRIASLETVLSMSHSTFLMFYERVDARNTLARRENKEQRRKSKSRMTDVDAKI